MSCRARLEIGIVGDFVFWIELINQGEVLRISCSVILETGSLRLRNY